MASSDRRPRLLDVNSLLALAWPNHQFHRVVPGHQQVTDAYLLDVAAKSRAVLLTLDQRLVVSDTARSSVEVVAP